MCARAALELREMSEFTRAQLLRVLEHAKEVIARSQELRRKLEDVIARIEETGTAKTPPVDRKVGGNRTKGEP